MKGIGTDEKRIIKEIIEHTNAQRQLIKEKYQNMYGHTLEQDLKSELNGNFEDVVVALLEPKVQYEAHCLRDAIHVYLKKKKLIIFKIYLFTFRVLEQMKRL